MLMTLKVYDMLDLPKMDDRGVSLGALAIGQDSFRNIIHESLSPHIKASIHWPPQAPSATLTSK
jgi:hypothetical protein